MRVETNRHQSVEIAVKKKMKQNLKKERKLKCESLMGRGGKLIAIEH